MESIEKTDIILKYKIGTYEFEIDLLTYEMYMLYFGDIEEYYYLLS